MAIRLEMGALSISGIFKELLRLNSAAMSPPLFKTSSSDFSSPGLTAAGRSDRFEFKDDGSVGRESFSCENNGDDVVMVAEDMLSNIETL